MNHFYVLRNNREAGPFTHAELKAHRILSTDLLWVDGESKEWKHPAEIEGLNIIFGEEAKRKSLVVKKDPSLTSSTSQPLPPQLISPGEFSAVPNNAAPSNNYKSATVIQKNKNKAAVYTIGAQLFGVVVVLIGLMLCGFVVINMLKQLAAKPATASEAVLLNAETLPASNSAHTAQAAQMQKTFAVAAVAVTKDRLLSEANLKKQSKTVAGTNASKAKAKLTDNTPKKNQPVQVNNTNETHPAEVAGENPEPAKPGVIPSSLQLSANDYKVGLFGGVSNLEITIANPSGQNVAKAIVEIEYLKPNGNVVRTQAVTAENIAAGASKTIQVPSSGRGVRVRYRVVSAE